MGKGAVVVHTSRSADFLRGHEGTTLRCVAESIARLKDVEFAGLYDPDCCPPGPLFVVPYDTLTRTEADGLGVRGADDLFGGVVSHEFVKTKIISHELVPNATRWPVGWSEEFTRRTREVVLPGYSVFDRADARDAIRRLLALGRVRAKRPRSAGARDQYTLESMADAETLFRGLDDADLARDGLLLEVNLESVTTLSIGQVMVDGMTLSYRGDQWLTEDNAGRSVYGGSELHCLRGGWDDLERREVDPAIRTAICQARTYDEATAVYGLVASRRNYDVGQGIDAAGTWRSGVFEASWRSGGASPAEVAALHVFARSSSVERVRVATVEAYGTGAEPPPEATVHFHGVDGEAGPVVRYTVIREIDG
jgi:uncharacterized protein DUF3182